MKKDQLSLLLKASMLMLAFMFVFSACKKDDDDDNDNPTVIEDGVYLKGGATALADYNSKGLFKSTRNEVNQADRAELMEIYVPIKADAAGFNIVIVDGGQPKVYGPGADFAVVPEAERITDEPKVDFWRGSYVESNTAFTVPTDGMYHVVIDTELEKVVIAPVVWGVIGAATPGGWSNSTALESQGFDLNNMTFQLENLVLTKADYKFRYSDGWKVVIDTAYDLGGGVKGIRVNTNYGGAVDALVPGGANISNTVPGLYTAKMAYTLGQGWVATMTKTGDLELNDYTNTSLGLVGDGLIVEGAQHNWDVTVMMSTPTVENETTYIWNFSNVEVTTLGSFKIREGQDWNGKVIGYNEVTMAGLSADKFTTNNDGNFVPTENGVYDMELKIDAVTETYTLTVNPAGQTVEMYILGNATSAGWSNNNDSPALPMTGTGGVYTITTNLTGGSDTFIKFIEVPGMWWPQYGTDATGTVTSGPLVKRTVEADPDPAAIPAPTVAGSYTITMNTNDMTYTIAAAK